MKKSILFITAALGLSLTLSAQNIIANKVQATLINYLNVVLEGIDYEFETILPAPIIPSLTKN